MKTARRIFAIGCCGLVMGGAMSVFATTQATARYYSDCDNQVNNTERKANKDYASGKLDKATYDKIMADIANHRLTWGC